MGRDEMRAEEGRGLLRTYQSCWPAYTTAFLSVYPSIQDSERTQFWNAIFPNDGTKVSVISRHSQPFDYTPVLGLYSLCARHTVPPSY